MLTAKVSLFMDRMREAFATSQRSSRRYGPKVYARKNVGRNWLKGSHGQRYWPNGARECARRRAQMAA